MNKEEYKNTKRRSQAIWYMYTRVGYSLEDIGGIFKISKSRVHQIINTEAAERHEELLKIKN